MEAEKQDLVMREWWWFESLNIVTHLTEPINGACLFVRKSIGHAQPMEQLTLPSLNLTGNGSY